MKNRLSIKLSCVKKYLDWKKYDDLGKHSCHPLRAGEPRWEAIKIIGYEKCESINL